METTGQQDYLRMSHDQQVKFRRLVGEFIRESRNARGNTEISRTAWENFAKAAEAELNINPTTLGHWFAAFQQAKTHIKMVHPIVRDDREKSMIKGFIAEAES